MDYKELEWKQSKFNEYRADVSIKGLFGIRFISGKNYNNDYYYKYIINGKHYGGYSGFECSSINHGKQLCEEKYQEICDKVIYKLIKG